MMTNDDGGGEGGKKCRKNDDVICERPLTVNYEIFHNQFYFKSREDLRAGFSPQLIEIRAPRSLTSL